MTDLLKSILDLAESVFTYSHVLSLIIGLAIGIGVTQVIKYPVSLAVLPEVPQLKHEKLFRWIIRTIAVVFAGIGTYATWPNGDGPMRLFISTAAAVMCPYVYWAIVRAIGHWLPWLSVTKDKDDPNEGGV